ncbi:MAG: type 4a pilus biogenesis protein PilO [Bdellovibrio sp.]|nr:type 4a pilus biogenesis protein PilO [Bdellovibrio sp.]
MEQLKSRLKRFPVTIWFMIAIGYGAFDYLRYVGIIFKENSDSPFLAKMTQIETAKQEVVKMQDKITKANAFLKNLENKKNELRSLAVELDNMKATLTESLDIPNFMKMLITEARKVGLNVLGLKPTGQTKKEFYSENAFELNFKGAYIQLLAYIDRLSQSQRVMRIASFNIKPSGSAQARFVELEGAMQVKGYYYLGSKADEISRKNNASQPITPNAGTTSGGQN